MLATGAQRHDAAGLRARRRARRHAAQEALDLTSQPKRLAVLGGGVVGSEFACFFAAHRHAGHADRDAAAAGARRGRRDRAGARARDEEAEASTSTSNTQRRGHEDARRRLGARSTLAGGKTVEVDTVLVATGRKPYANDLGLETLGVARGDRGKIVVNDHLQTSVKGVYAIGDVTDIKQLAHFASAQGKAAAEIIAGHPAQTNWRAVPGGDVHEPRDRERRAHRARGAQAEGRTLKIGRFPFRAHGRNIADGEIDRVREAGRRRRHDQVLGAHIIGAKASEIIHECALAIAADLNIEDLARRDPRPPDRDRGAWRGRRGRRRRPPSISCRQRHEERDALAPSPFEAPRPPSPR